MSDVEFLIVLLAASAVLVRLAYTIRVPYPIALVLGGIAIAAIPGRQGVAIKPDVILVVFLPALLAAAGFASSARELRTEAGPLAALAVGLVLLTMTSVAVLAHALVGGLPWTAAFVLGAVVAPTDPVSAVATFTRTGAPARVRLIVEGESLINDAAALVAFRVAVTAAVSGTFRAPEAGLDFLLSSLGGVAIGLAAGVLVRAAVRREDETALAIVLTVLGAYGAYVIAERLGASGVLAAVVFGLHLGWYAHSTFEPDARLSAISFWNVLVFALTAMLFIILGVQLPAALHDARSAAAVPTLLRDSVLIAGLVIGVRMAFAFLPVGLGTWRERIVMGWSGMRGAVSLAAVLSIPATVDGGGAFPRRDLIIVVTVAVILATLVGQGLTLAPLMRLLGVKGERGWSIEEATARLEAAQSALDRLDELEDEGASEEMVRRLRDLYRARFRRCVMALGGEPDSMDAVEDRHRSYLGLRRDLISTERATLLDLRARGEVRQAVLRLIERDLDLEEARLR
jgi:Na+/H+ antiporter